MKKIVLITKQYPYADREQFLDAELAYCGENNIAVDIVCAFVASGEKRLRALPECVRVVKRMNAARLNIKTPLRFIKSRISHYRKEEIQTLKSQGTYTAQKAKRLSKFLMKAITIAEQIESLYKRELTEAPESIVLYSYWKEEAALAALILKDKYGCRAVSRVHGYDLYLERHGEGYFPFHERTVTSLSAIFPVSDTGREYLYSKYGKLDNVTVKRLATVDCGLTKTVGEKFTIVSCSNVIELKRVGLIAEAMVKLDDERVRWIHFGDGPLLESVRKIAAENTKTECIIAGRVNHSAVFDYYKNNKVDLFINVSTTEGLPVSIMEAASFGIPVVATDVGGTHEIVLDGKCGTLLPPDLTSDLLLEAIRSYVGMSSEQHCKFAESARAVWAENYEHRKVYEEFYKTVSDGN